MTETIEKEISSVLSNKENKNIGDKSIESQLVNIGAYMREIESSLKILQCAVQNEFEEIEKHEIDDCLEVLIDRLESTIVKYDNMSEEVSILLGQEH